MESTNGLNLRDDYPQILGDSTTKALIWRQAWLLNVCFFVLSLGVSKKINGPRINGWECPLLRSFGVVLEPPKGWENDKGTKLEYSSLKYEFFKAFVPLLVLSLGASGSSLNLLRTGRIVLSLGACLRSASLQMLQEPQLKHFTEACGWKLATPSLRQRGGSCLGYCSCSCFGHLAASAFGGCFGHKYAAAASTKVRSAGKGRILAT